MIVVPAGFNGAISPKLDACVSPDCSSITLSDVTLLSSVANPFGWTTDTAESPRPRILTAFKEIRVIITNSSGNEVVNVIVYAPPSADSAGINFFPSIDDFNDNMPLSTVTWGQDDGLYGFTYQFTYLDSGGSFGDPDNELGLQENIVKQEFNKLVTCKSQNAVKDLWLKYLDNCCDANRDDALEAEALLNAVEAAGACADEFKAQKIKDALDKIIALSTNSCTICKTTKCNC